MNDPGDRSVMTARHPLPRTAETRQVLLDQLAHLVEEAAALKRFVDLVPPPVLEGRPLESDPSIKEIYGMLVACDERVYGPAVLQCAVSEEVSVEAPDEADLEGATWNAVDMLELLERVQSARSNLVQRLARLPAELWCRTKVTLGESTDLYGLADHIIQHDAVLLRTAAHRLHESKLTSRDEDLPK
jgi:hypothetical protein